MVYGGKLYTQANEYVKEGMVRFVDEKYSTGLPTGGMIGYVVDGLCDNAIDAVSAAIDQHRDQLHVSPSETLKPYAIKADEKIVKESEHSPPGRGILLYHVFLSCVSGKAAGVAPPRTAATARHPPSACG